MGGMGDVNHNHLLRTISVIVLVFFLWTFGGLCEITYALNSAIEQKSGSTEATDKQEKKLQKALEDIEGIITDTVTDTGTKKNKLKTKKTEIGDIDVELRQEFSNTEKFLKEKRLPAEILQRHRDFVRKYEENLNELNTNLDAVESAVTESEINTQIEKLKAFLEKVKPPKKHIPLDPNKLPHRTAEPVFKEPRTKPEEFRELSTVNREPILVASAGSLSGLLSSTITQASSLPTPADLSETIEVQFTPEIKAKAEELNHNPVKIYNWVRNNIEFVPTYGSIQGANMCLQTKQCNAFDTASLLIALLRASNIPARYVYGTIELPIEKVMNWVGGFTDANAALTLIASGGIPVKGLTSGGKIVAVRMEHVWVEAYVPYGNYRGIMRDDSIKTWIPMDGSFKQYTYKEPIDFPSAVGFDIQGFINEVQSASTIDTVNSSISNVPQNLILQRFQEYVQKVRQYYDTNLQDKTIWDIIGAKKVIAKDYPYLLGSLPYKTTVVGNKYSQLPDPLRWRINFKVFSSIYSFDPDFSYTASTPFLAGKSITLSYRPSTSYDESLVQSYGYIEKVPPYLLNLTPELIIGGEVIASGIPVGSGKDIDFIMTFISPRGSQDVITNKETAGAHLGIGLDLTWLSKSLLDKKIAELNQIYNSPAPNPNRKIQESLSLLASLYFAELDAMNAVGERFAKVVNIRHPSAGIVGADLKVSYLWGIPRTLSFAGLFIDVDRDIHSTVAKDGDRNKVTAFNIKSGYNGSAMEHALWEQVYNLPGVSAVKVHQLANQMGIPIHKIDQSNVSSILPLLQISYDVKSDITNAVDAGKVVYVPQKNIQYFDWIGTAYIVIDPNTGTGGYIISGGWAGGGDSLWLDCIESLIQLLDLVPILSTARWAQIYGYIIEILTAAAALHDVAQKAEAPSLNKGIAAFLAIISVALGIAALYSGPLSLFLIVGITIVEVLLYASIFYLLEGKWPVIEANPLKECFELLGI